MLDCIIDSLMQVLRQQYSVVKSSVKKCFVRHEFVLFSYLPVPWVKYFVFPTDCLQVTSATNGSAAECTLVEEEPWKHE